MQLLDGLLWVYTKKTVKVEIEPGGALCREPTVFLILFNKFLLILIISYGWILLPENFFVTLYKILCDNFYTNFIFITIACICPFGIAILHVTNNLMQRHPAPMLQ